jgi:hypothetical protein
VSEGPTAAKVERLRLLDRVFSFPAAICFLLMVLATFTCRSRFDDPDMWWHLKLGETIWTTHTIPSSDLLSYTTAHHAYLDHEWLAQTCIYAAYHLGGYSGLMLWLCCVCSAILVAGYLLCSLYSGNAKVAFLGALAIWLFATIGFSVRPQLIGYLLLIVELMLLHLGRTRDPRWFFGLPPVFCIWVNCHGSFFFGAALAGALLFSSCFSFQSRWIEAPPWEPRSRRILAWAFLLSVATLFLNPVGPGLVVYPLNALLFPSAGVGIGVVSEWQPVQFSEPRGIALLGLLGCIVLVLALRRSRLLFHELLWLIPAAWLAVSHRRLLFPFGIVAAPVLCRLLASSWEGYDAQRDRRMPNLALMAGSMLVAYSAFPSSRNLSAQVEERSPVKAVDFIKSHRLTGPMMNEWIYGGYLIWAAPEYPVFIDGRADIFQWTGVLSEYGAWMQGQSDPNLLLDRYQINFCLLKHDSQMENLLPMLHGWRLAYSDDNSLIFIRLRPLADTAN